MGIGGDLGGQSKKHKQERVGSVGADRGYLDAAKGTKKEAQGTEGLHNACRESLSPLASDERFFLRRINAASSIECLGRHVRIAWLFANLYIHRNTEAHKSRCPLNYDMSPGTCLSFSFLHREGWIGGLIVTPFGRIQPSRTLVFPLSLYSPVEDAVVDAGATARDLGQPLVADLHVSFEHIRREWSGFAPAECDSLVDGADLDHGEDRAKYFILAHFEKTTADRSSTIVNNRQVS